MLDLTELTERQRHAAASDAAERGYSYLVPEHLVSGQDTGDETDDRAVRDWLRYNQPDRLIEEENYVLECWKRSHHE